MYLYASHEYRYMSRRLCQEGHNRDKKVEEVINEGLRNEETDVVEQEAGRSKIRTDKVRWRWE